MTAMLFELIDGQPVPRLPRAADGSPRVADGVSILSLDQAAAKTGRTPQQLGKLWHATLEEIFPGAADLFTDADKPPTPAREDLRRAMFPELADAELAAQFEFLCTRRGLDPWCGQVRPKILVNGDGSRRVELMLGIEGFRLIAHRTGTYVGIDATDFFYTDLSKKQIESARTTVYKMIGGQRGTFVGEARWAEYVGIPADQSSVKQFRDQMPHTWMSKCSEAAALRRAYPQELGGIYTPEEMAALDARPNNPGPDRRDEADQRPAHDDDDSQLPDAELAVRRRRQTAGAR